MDNIELIKFVEKLIKSSSSNPTISVLPNEVCKTLKIHKIKYSIVESNGIKNIISHTSDKTNIILNGHWDTIQGKETYFSFKKNIISGLGACDMKSGIAAMVAAFIDCYREKIPGVTLCLVGDEELGGTNGTKILVDRNIVGNYIILGEPTNLQISLGQKGNIRCTLTAHGKSAHGAYPQLGQNAIINLIQVINLIMKEYSMPSKNIDPQDLFSMVTVSVNKIEGGTSENVVPDRAVAVLDIRIPPNIKIDSIMRIILKHSKLHDIDVKFNILGKGWELDKESKIAQISKVAVKQVIGKNPKFIYKMGTNDGRYYVGNNNCQIINIGPGDNKLSHTNKEKIHKEEIIQARKIYFELLKKLINE